MKLISVLFAAGAFLMLSVAFDIPARLADLISVASASYQARTRTPTSGISPSPSTPQRPPGRAAKERPRMGHHGGDPPVVPPPPRLMGCDPIRDAPA